MLRRLKPTALAPKFLALFIPVFLVLSGIGFWPMLHYDKRSSLENLSRRVGNNAARAALKSKTRELLSSEGSAEFGSQIKLLNQAVVNYLDISDSPPKCEEFLTKVMVQLEELEGRFAEFDEFVVQLSEKREEIYNAFETRKLALVEARNKRAGALMSAADKDAEIAALRQQNATLQARVKELETGTARLSVRLSGE